MQRQCGTSVAMFEEARSARWSASQGLAFEVAILSDNRGVPSAAAGRARGNGAAGGQSTISAAPAPSNNRLKLAARGRSVAESRQRSRAAA